MSRISNEYREDLENPPLLVVCDLERFEVHTNFTGTAKQVYRFSLDDLLKNQATADCKLPPIDVLRAVFTDPARLRPDRSAADVTEMAAAEFATLADSLRARGVDPQRAAHFLMRLLFCLFAEDIGLLPPKLFSVLLERTRHRPADFKARLAQLFAAMATDGTPVPRLVPRVVGFSDYGFAAFATSLGWTTWIPGYRVKSGPL